jgi:asparagine synthase (glutamine-hydrolysing)
MRQQIRCRLGRQLRFGQAMCGIAGFTGARNPALLHRMTSKLTHRGPDSAGFWEGAGVSLGMRRLAIIDLATGEQPVFNEDHSVAVVFNGEIYNHLELRADLLKVGHRFTTDHSDTEVIVHLYEQYGADFLHHLNGMFAIALWDQTRRELLLARDRLGIKPLYVASLRDGVAFGSEPKALLEHPEVSREPNALALHHYLSLKNVPAPLSAFRGIEQLRNGELAICCGSEITRRRWWRPSFDQIADVDEIEAAAKIRMLLEDSVRLQMRSDVPFGAYLSGGIDSSSIVALLARQGVGKIKTFTLVYEDDFPSKDNDRRFARIVANRYGTEHHEHLVTFQDLPEQLDQIVRAFDEPFSGVISTYFITQSIARHVKVALSGDGADELFASYLPHRIAAPLAAYGAGRNDPDSLVPFENDISRLAALHARGDEAARRMGLYLLDDGAKSNLYAPEMERAVGGETTEAFIRSRLDGCGSNDAINRALFLDLETLLPDQVLPFVDRLSMAHSVEVRPAFLDHRLVEFACSLPGHFKIKAGRVKSILKEALRELLPADLVARPKEGFIMPINEWLIGHLKSYVCATLAPEKVKRQGLFRPDAIMNMLDAHFSGHNHYGNQIWNLLMLQLWWEGYVDRPT